MNTLSKKKTNEQKQIKLVDLKTRKNPKGGNGGATAPHGPAPGPG